MEQSQSEQKFKEIDELSNTKFNQSMENLKRDFQRLDLISTFQCIKAKLTIEKETCEYMIRNYHPSSLESIEAAAKLEVINSILELASTGLIK